MFYLVPQKDKTDSVLLHHHFHFLCHKDFQQQNLNAVLCLPVHVIHF
ncbi:hypothetical protein X975_26282, partial [Stegodyphus mimosarum]